MMHVAVEVEKSTVFLRFEIVHPYMSSLQTLQTLQNGVLMLMDFLGALGFKFNSV